MGQEEIRLDKYLAAIWRAKWLIILGVAAAIGGALLLAQSQPPVYTATVLIKPGQVWKELLEDPYFTEIMINNGALAGELSAETGMKRRQIKRGIHAELILGGPRK